jgi:two-component system phosphate regulon sensor histidine kinase PhoR
MSMMPECTAITSSALETLQKSESFFRALIENSSDAIALMTPEGNFLYLSPPVKKILGYTPEELVGRCSFDLLPPDQLPFAIQQFSKIAQNPGVTQIKEHQYLHKDGTLRWMESTTTNLLDNPHVQAIVANFRDITDRKQMEKQLKESQDQLSAILKNTADGITVQDRTGKMIYANHAAALIAGYSSVEELLQAPLLEYQEKFSLTDEYGRPFPPDQLPGRRAIQGEENPQVTVCYTNKDTTEKRWSIIKATAIRDAQDQPYIVINTIQDITHLKELEQRKDDFISIASHELKTPLTSIKGFTQILQNRFKKNNDEATLQLLFKMERQLNKLTKLISDLLDISKMQAGKLSYSIEPFDLDLLIREVVENLQETTRTHQLQLESTTGLWVAGDKDRLGQVLINLLTNAIKYSPKANTVIIRARAEQETVLVSVQDFGIGIAESHHQKIFEQFYQVTDEIEKTFPGLGIGLHITGEIIQRHQGRIWVESTKGHGSTFTFTLPLIEPKSGEVAASA